jgi:hypothetical protein
MIRSIMVVTSCFFCMLVFSQQTTKKANNIFAAAQLTYPISDTMNAVGFYTEVSFAKGADSKVASVTAIQLKRATLGVAIGKNKARTVAFSVKRISSDKAAGAVSLKAKGYKVEEVGGSSKFSYSWKTDNTYRFYLNVLSDSATSTNIYTAYFFIPEQQKWKLLASYAATNDTATIQEVSAIVQFNNAASTTNGSKVYLGNQWMIRDNGEYREVTEAAFSKITKNNRPANNLVAGIEDDRFYFAKAPNGIAIKQRAELGRTGGNKKPVIDVTKNIDSLVQWQKDRDDILQAVKEGKVDTTGSKDGVYYLQLKEGAGAEVAVTDTVTVFYKGTLLEDGSMFDETKKDPVTFPLNRLIRGWQVGVPLVKVGGKIKLIIPSAMAYSIRSRSKDIPPNSVLVFDIEVVSTKKAVKI